MAKQLDTGKRKQSLRIKTLVELERYVEDIVVLETNGGLGKLYAQCYGHIQRGVVMEKNATKAEKLLQQRGQKWSVYECDCVTGVREGLGSHLPINFVDVDPYGDPWPVIEVFFQSRRPWPAILAVVVNDGLRQLVQRGGAWTTDTLRDKVKKYGNTQINNCYLEICKELMEEKAALRGYGITHWTAYSCGDKNLMSHYAAILAR